MKERNMKLSLVSLIVGLLVSVNLVAEEPKCAASVYFISWDVDGAKNVPNNSIVSMGTDNNSLYAYKDSCTRPVKIENPESVPYDAVIVQVDSFIETKPSNVENEVFELYKSMSDKVKSILVEDLNLFWNRDFREFAERLQTLS